MSLKKWLECRLDPDIDKNTVVTKMYKKQNTQKVEPTYMTDILWSPFYPRAVTSNTLLKNIGIAQSLKSAISHFK